MSIRIKFSASYSVLCAISESWDTDFAGQVDKPWVLSVSSEALVPNYSYFDTCSKPRASAASAYNWVGYRTFNVMVLKCMHYINCFANWVYRRVLTGIWQASSLPIKSSGPAGYKLAFRINCHTSETFFVLNDKFWRLWHCLYLTNAELHQHAHRSMLQRAVFNTAGYFTATTADSTSGLLIVRNLLSLLRQLRLCFIQHRPNCRFS